MTPGLKAGVARTSEDRVDEHVRTLLHEIARRVRVPCNVTAALRDAPGVITGFLGLVEDLALSAQRIF